MRRRGWDRRSIDINMLWSWGRKAGKSRWGMDSGQIKWVIAVSEMSVIDKI